MVASEKDETQRELKPAIQPQTLLEVVLVVVVVVCLVVKIENTTSSPTIDIRYLFWSNTVH